MINSVNNSSQAAQAYQPQQLHQNNQVHKNAQNDKEPQDTVVLSKQATQAGDVDHDGDRH
ncbi:MAG TPA: hypothetical protein VFW44_06105 [Bryobacteraceae bacterium]|nr:hypothetical protein [Bryobacteraceae bacterium]